MLLAFLAVPLGMRGQTYKLQQVTSVEAGGLYVFEQDGYVMNNNVSSSALQTTNTYNTTGLGGSEAYVWTLETATNGFYMKNVSLSSNQYLNNASSTGVSLGSKSSIWAFNFQTDNTVVIQNKSNSDRFLGYTSTTSHAYKAYATSNLSSSNYPHAVKVYQLVAEGSNPTVATPTFSPAEGTYTEAQNVTISCTTEDVTIYYTLDGSAPTTSSSVYSTALNITETTTVKAMAVKSNYNNSAVATATYTINSPYSGPDYVRVTDMSYLTDGATVILAARYNTTSTSYYAMTAATTGKPEGVAVSSTTTSNGEALPTEFLNSESTFRWTVSATTNGYTFTNASNEVLGYSSSTNFSTGGDNTEWTVARATSGDAAMVTGYEGFVITNKNSDTRAVALNNSHNYGPYATSNMNSGDYNFYLDFFVKGATPAVAPSITAANVEINYDDEEGEIAFEINNGVTGGAVSAEVWGTPTITNFDLGNETTSPISFTCDANGSATDRTAVVRLTYTYNTNETKTKNVTITQTANPNTIDNISDITTTGANYAVKGTIVAKSARGLVFGDGTGYVYYYNQSYDQTAYNVGDIKKISGTMSHYNNSVFQFTNTASIEAATESNYNNTPAIQVLDADGITAYSSNGPHLSNYVQIQGTLSKTTSGNNTYYNLTITGLANTASIAYPTSTQAAALDALVDGAVVVKGYFAGVSSDHFNVVMESVEAASVPTYELEIYEPQHGTVTVSIGDQIQTGTDGSYQIPQGSTVTLTATPDPGYRFVEWTALPDEGSITIANNQFVMPTCYVLVEATFEAIPTYVYMFTTNGVSETPIEEEEGYVITLPSSANLLSDKFVFVGWTTDANDVSNIKAAGTQVTLDDDIEFTAVYSHTTTIGGSNSKTGEASYVKVTSTGEITDGEYLIVSSGINNNEEFNVAFNGALQALDPTGVTNKIDVTIDNNTIASSTEVDAATFTIAGIVENNTVTGYSIQSKSGIYIGKSTDANGMDQSETVVANAITYNSTNECVDIVGTGGAYLRYNAASGTEKFRYYKSSTYTAQKAIQLYKYTPGSSINTNTTKYYTRVFLNNPTGNVAIAGPSIIPSGYTLDMGSNTLTNNYGAASLLIEDGAQLKTHTAVDGTIEKAITGYGSSAGGYYLIAAPAEIDATPNGSGFLPDNHAEVDFYYFDQEADVDGNEWINYKYGNNTITGPIGLERKVGYLYANKNNTTLIFSTATWTTLEDPTDPNNHNTISHNSPFLATDVNQEVPLEYSGNSPLKGYNLIGNPFTCTAYLSDKTRDFARMNAEGNEIVLADPSDRTIGVCEGIFVMATGNSQSVIFTTTEPVSSTGNNNGMVNISVAQVVNSRDAQPSADYARIRINNGENMSKFVFNENNSHVYIPQDGKNYAVVRSEARGEMPVNFKAAEAGTYTISVEAENLDVNYLHLIDNMTGMDVDLLATPSYTFEGKKSDYASRFKLVFSANADNNETEDFAFVNDGNIIILNEGEATLQVIDIMGRVISTQTVNGNASVNNVGTAGVYVLQLINGNNVKTQKIVVR